MSRWVVVLAGGVGSRFWPLSTPSRPKQLLPLIGEEPLLVETLERMRPLAPAENTLVLANASLIDPICTVLPAFPRGNIVSEPRPAGTAAALAWAATEIAQRDSDHPVMICVHADSAIGEEDIFRRTIDRAADAASREEALVTVGIVPTRPDTGFGYIQPGAAISEGVLRVLRFVEKPDAASAKSMMESGYLWNSGIFVWRVEDFLKEVRALTPEVSDALEHHGGSDRDASRFFAGVRPISVDEGVLERSTRVLVVPGTFPWDDVGTWGALRRAKRADQDGNVVHGEAHLVKSSGNVVHADGNRVVLFGVSDLVVVTRDGLSFVTTIDRSAHLKTLLETLPDDLQACT